MVIANPADGDLGAVFGIGFLPFTGGPFRYVDAIGAAEIVATMQDLENKFGPKFRPARILKEMADSSQKFHDDTKNEVITPANDQGEVAENTESALT